MRAVRSQPIPAGHERETRLLARSFEARIGHLPSQHFMQHHAHAEDVGLHVPAKLGRREIRCHVVKRSPEVAGSGCRGADVFLPRHLKVDELDRSIRTQEDVTGLYVAVDDAAR